MLQVLKSKNETMEWKKRKFTSHLENVYVDFLNSLWIDKVIDWSRDQDFLGSQHDLYLVSSTWVIIIHADYVAAMIAAMCHTRSADWAEDLSEKSHWSRRTPHSILSFFPLSEINRQREKVKTISGSENC